MTVHTPGEKKEKDIPQVKTQEMFMMRRGPATHYFRQGLMQRADSGKGVPLGAVRLLKCLMPS